MREVSLGNVFLPLEMRKGHGYESSWDACACLQISE